MWGFVGRFQMLKSSDSQILSFEVSNESASVSETDLRQVQGRPPPRGGADHLFKSEAQAATRVNLRM
jgi:hypothetical protein